MEEEGYRGISKRNKIIGALWLAGPTILLVLILASYAITSFVIGTLASDPSGGSDSAVMTGQIISMILGLLGIVALLGIIIGIPLGIYYLTRTEEMKGEQYDHQSGPKGEEIPEEIKGWNWGAAGLTWIWGISNGVWISLLVFIPIVNIFMIVILGLKGNEWAWRARQWKSVKHFKDTQRKWKPWGILFFVFSMIGIVAQLAGFGDY